MVHYKNRRATGTLRTMLSNAGHGGVRGLVLLINTVVLVPLLMSTLGKPEFALLALVTPFLRYGFNGVFDLGFATGTVRYASRSFAVCDREAVNGYLSSAMAMYVGSGALVLVLYYALRAPLLGVLLRGHAELLSPAQSLFERAAWIYALFLLSNPFFSGLMAAHKMEATHWIGTFALLLELGGVLALAPFGITLARVIWVYAASAGLSLLFSIFLTRRYLPELELGWKHVAGGKVREILGYGMQFSATTFTALLGPILDKLILTRFVGLSAVAFYEAAARLMDLLRRATQLFLLPLFPLAGAREATQGMEERRDFYRRAFSANLLLSCGLYLLPGSLAFVAVPWWLGPGSETAAACFVVLALSTFCLAVVGPVTMIFLGTAQLRPLMTTAWTGLAINLLLSPLFASRWALAGVLAGNFLAYGIVSLVYLAWTMRLPEFQLSPPQVLKQAGGMGLAAVLPGVLWTRWFWRPGEAPAWPMAGLAVAGGIFLAAALTYSEHRRVLGRAWQEVQGGIRAFSARFSRA